MRTLIVSTLVALGLTGGVAAADEHGEARAEVRVEHVEHYRDRRVRPPVRVERHDERRGYRWVDGGWQWGRGEWIWAPGHYIRGR